MSHGDCIITYISIDHSKYHSVQVSPHQIEIATFGAANARALQTGLLRAAAELEPKIDNIEKLAVAPK